MNVTIPDIIGIVGVFLVLLFYFLIQAGKCRADSVSFSLGNTVGSILILVSLWFHWNLASVVIEVSWLLISLYGLFRTQFCSKSSS